MDWKLAWLLLSTLATVVGFIVLAILVLTMIGIFSAVLGFPAIPLVLAILVIAGTLQFTMTKDPRKRNP